MKIDYTPNGFDSIRQAPQAIQKAFFKQVKFLEQNLNHPSLHAKKYNEREDKWQARVNRSWRFYFRIVGDTYIITDIISHPK